MKSILIIEDDPMLQLVYARLLQDYGAQVYVCSNIAEAADCVSKNSLDLIISDYNLPDATSMVLLKLIKIWKSEIPMIVITANNLIKLENPGLDNLINALMFKPINRGEFYQNVDSCLSACA